MKKKEIPRFRIKMGKKTIDTNLFYLAKTFKKIKEGYSPIIGICGKQRTGKSLLAVWLCYMFMEFMNKEYDPTKYTFYDPIAAVSNLEDQDRIPLLIDEAGSILHRREFYERLHQSLNKVIQTQGYKTILYIFVSPFISDIDKSFTKHFDFILRVDKRGRYKAFEVMKRYDQNDANKSSYKRFMDDVAIKLSDVPSQVWKSYQYFSIDEKEKMRKQIEVIEMQKKRKEEKASDPLETAMRNHGVRL